jgi:hypothetical protein
MWYLTGTPFFSFFLWSEISLKTETTTYIASTIYNNFYNRQIIIVVTESFVIFKIIIKHAVLYVCINDIIYHDTSLMKHVQFTWRLSKE